MGYINSWIGWFMMENPKKKWMIEQSHFRLFESDMTNLKLDLVFAQTSSDIHIHTFSCPFPDILRYKLIVLASGDQLSPASLGESHHPWGPNPRWRFQNCKTFQQLRCLKRLVRLDPMGSCSPVVLPRFFRWANS